LKMKDEEIRKLRGGLSRVIRTVDDLRDRVRAGKVTAEEVLLELGKKALDKEPLKTMMKGVIKETVGEKPPEREEVPEEESELYDLVGEEYVEEEAK